MRREIGLIIIGDEILSGKRRDRHLHNAQTLLRPHGLSLAWSLIIGDSPQRIRATLRQTAATPDIVFCFGGIGATPDDYTRQCAAEAFDEPLVRHPQAIREIEAQYGKEGLLPTRILMAEIPQSSRIIPNPYNRIPGFSVQDHHFLPGFPQMAEPMMAWVLEEYYRELYAPPAAEQQWNLLTHEGPIIPLMQQLNDRFPQLKVASLPRLDTPAPLVEFVLSGEVSQLQQAAKWVENRLVELGIECRR